MWFGEIPDLLSGFNLLPACSLNPAQEAFGTHCRGPDIMSIPGRFQNKQVRGSAFAVLLAALPSLRSIRNPQTLPSKELPSWGTAAWRRGHRSEEHCSGLVPKPLLMARPTQKWLPPAITAGGLWSSMETMFFLHPTFWRGEELRNQGFPGRGFLASSMFKNIPTAPEMLLFR